MSLSTVTVSYDVADLVGADFSAQSTEVVATTNISTETVIDTSGNQFRLGAGKGTIAVDGTGSVSVWVPGSGSNPASWQTYIAVTYTDTSRGGRKKHSFGPFTITGVRTVTNKALTSNVATLTTSAPHGLVVGNSVTVAGVDSTFNGSFTVVAVPTSMTFTYAKTASNVSSASSSGTVFSASLQLAALVEEQEVPPTWLSQVVAELQAMIDQAIQGPPGTPVSLKASVANQAALPSVGNSAGDARQANDTGHLWSWNGTAWSDAGQWRGASGVGILDSVVPGNNIDVDNTDPANPVVSVETLTIGDISGVTATAAEVNRLAGVTSAVQTQIDTKFTNSIATDKLLGRDTTGTGAVEQLGLGAGLSITGGNLTMTSGGGDVVGPAGSVTDGHLPEFDGTTGELLRSAGVGLSSKAQAIPFTVSLVRENTAVALGTGSPPANTEVLSTSKVTRGLMDLANATQVRLVANPTSVGAGANGAAIKLSYMTTMNSTWSGADAGAAVVLGVNGGAVGELRDSGWQTLAVGARISSCYLAVLVGVAFGATAPSVSSITAYFR